MDRSILLTFVAVLVLVDSSVAYVAIMGSGNNTSVYGCMDFNSDCTSAEIRNHCCAGSACECDGNDANCRCIPLGNPPSTCAAENADCDIRKGCCNGDYGCDCSVGPSCQCVRHQCLWEGKTCTARKNGCCGSFFCDCTNPAECRCKRNPPPPPPPCLLRRQPCGHNKSGCCPGDYCANNIVRRQFECAKEGLLGG